MLTTIRLATRIAVQGEFVTRLPGGDVVVSDGARVYRGRPVDQCHDAATRAGEADRAA